MSGNVCSFSPSHVIGNSDAFLCPNHCSASYFMLFLKSILQIRVLVILWSFILLAGLQTGYFH